MKYINLRLVLSASSGPECSHTYLGRAGQGRITSYNFPFNYRHNLTCQYSIVLNTPPEGTKIVCLTFHRFQLETSTPFCSFDYLKLDYVNLKYCGTGLWQYGVQTNNANSNVWSRNFCCKYFFLDASLHKLNRIHCFVLCSIQTLVGK